MKEKSELAGLKNIGPTIEKRLNEVGIMNRADLEARRSAGVPENKDGKSPQDDTGVLLLVFAGRHTLGRPPCKDEKAAA